MNLAELQAESYAHSAAWFPELHGRGHWPLTVQYGLGLNEEAGEVGGVVKKANICGGLMDECDLHKPGKHSRQALQDEMADVLVYLTAWAEHEGIDLMEAVRHKNAELTTRWGNPDAVPS